MIIGARRPGGIPVKRSSGRASSGVGRKGEKGLFGVGHGHDGLPIGDLFIVVLLEHDVLFVSPSAVHKPETSHNGDNHYKRKKKRLDDSSILIPWRWQLTDDDT